MIPIFHRCSTCLIRIEECWYFWKDAFLNNLCCTKLLLWRSIFFSAQPSLMYGVSVSQKSIFSLCTVYIRYSRYNLFYSNTRRYYSNCNPRGGSSGASHVNYEQCSDSGWSYSAVCTGPGYSIFCARCAFASFPKTSESSDFVLWFYSPPNYDVVLLK